MNIVYDHPTPDDTDVDIGLVFALSTGYRATPESFGVDPTSANYNLELRRLYNYGVRMGKLTRVGATGKQTSWVLPTEGRWPTVAEMRRRYACNPPDTRWMTGTRPDLSFYTNHHRPAGSSASDGVEDVAIADSAFEHDIFERQAQRASNIFAL